MDPKKLRLIAISSGGMDLPPKIEAKANDRAWWQRLEATPEEKLDAEQVGFLQALGVELSGAPRSSQSEPNPLDFLL